MSRKKRPENKNAAFIKVAFIVVFAILAFLELPSFFGGGLSFYAFDVGQADAFLFRLPGGENVLVDAGSRASSRALVSRLRNLGVRQIELAVATHPHEDHIGGMTDVIRAFPVKRFWDSGYNYGSEIQSSMLRTLRGRGVKFERPKAGHREDFGEVSIEVIAPVRDIRGTESDANNNSLVLRVVYGDVAFLMTGDMETVERASVKQFPRAAVLKLAHHGSRNGTDERILREVSPDLVVLSYGDGNPHGHPHNQVLDLIARFNIRSRATKDGEIRITSDGRTLKVRPAR
ncbi:MAG: MBL fold metallo-hydrolase [Synergistaceae bacterium]|nr:MBL fold metallo-hydrolase [Synergistaceae bacterium]